MKIIVFDPHWEGLLNIAHKSETMLFFLNFSTNTGDASEWTNILKTFGAQVLRGYLLK